MPMGIYKHKPRSEETKRKISEGRLRRKELLGYLISPETRKKMSDTHKRLGTKPPGKHYLLKYRKLTKQEGNKRYYERHKAELRIKNSEKKRIERIENPEMVRLQDKIRRNRYKERFLAHDKVHQAVKSGKLKKPNSCEKCGTKCVPNGHHPDYDKPLEVKWLCKECHLKEHSKLHLEEALKAELLKGASSK